MPVVQPPFDVLDVTCPSCKAAAGEPCQIRSKKPGKTHTTRQDKAIRAHRRRMAQIDEP